MLAYEYVLTYEYVRIGPLPAVERGERGDRDEGDERDAMQERDGLGELRDEDSDVWVEERIAHVHLQVLSLLALLVQILTPWELEAFRRQELSETQRRFTSTKVPILTPTERHLRNRHYGGMFFQKRARRRGCGGPSVSSCSV